MCPEKLVVAIILFTVDNDKEKWLLGSDAGDGSMIQMILNPEISRGLLKLVVAVIPHVSYYLLVKHDTSPVDVEIRVSKTTTTSKSSSVNFTTSINCHAMKLGSRDEFD